MQKGGFTSLVSSLIDRLVIKVDIYLRLAPENNGAWMIIVPLKADFLLLQPLS